MPRDVLYIASDRSHAAAGAMVVLRQSRLLDNTVTVNFHIFFGNVRDTFALVSLALLEKKKRVRQGKVNGNARLDYSFGVCPTRNTAFRNDVWNTSITGRSAGLNVHIDVTSDRKDTLI